MRSVLLSCLVVLCGLYAIRCATINFQAWRTSQVYKNFDLKCEYYLVPKSEFFSSLSIIVNNTIFYTYNNQTVRSMYQLHLYKYITLFTMFVSKYLCILYKSKNTNSLKNKYIIFTFSSNIKG